MPHECGGQVNQFTFDLPGTITSVVRGTNADVIVHVAHLGWITDEDRVFDATYGRGKWWTKYRPPHLAYLIPHEGDFRRMDGIGDHNWDVVAFDPPYVLVGGRETSTVPDLLDRYGLRGPTSLEKLFADIAAGIAEAHRVLRPGGRLLVKCSDFVSSGRFVTGHHQVVSTALAQGFEQVDELVHYSGTGPQPPGRRQVHSRRAHSFMCIFEKPSRRSLASTPCA